MLVSKGRRGESEREAENKIGREERGGRKVMEYLGLAILLIGGFEGEQCSLG